MQPLHPLRTSAFPAPTTHHATSPTLTSTSAISSSRSSPLDRSFRGFRNSSASSLARRIVIVRREKSAVEVEMEEERTLVGERVVGAVVEPRPSVGAAVGGIEEVLGGRV